MKDGIKKLSVLVVSFDGYKDVWPYFFECKNKYWNEYAGKVYLVSNFESIEENCTVIKTGKETNWCDRVLKVINSLEDKDIILLLDDYLIGDYVDSLQIKEIFNFYHNNGCRYLRLVNIPKKHNRKNQEVFPILENEEYGINLQPAIWNVEFLKAILQKVGGSRSAWEFESYLLEHCTRDVKPVNGCYATYDNVLNIHNGILQGKWFPNEIWYFNKRGIIIDTTSRGILSKKKVYLYKFKRIVRENLPNTFRKRLKMFLKRFGIKFITNV